MATTDYSRLQRPRYPMPAFVLEAMVAHSVRDAYYRRPAYQQNDYIWWITSPKQEKTRQKRLIQMINELRDGGLYMRMPYRPKAETRSSSARKT